MQHFFEMGGYAMYVWPAYSISILVLTAFLFQNQRFKKRITKKIKNYYEQNS